MIARCPTATSAPIPNSSRLPAGEFPSTEFALGAGEHSRSEGEGCYCRPVNQESSEMLLLSTLNSLPFILEPRRYFSPSPLVVMAGCPMCIGISAIAAPRTQVVWQLWV